LTKAVPNKSRRYSLTVFPDCFQDCLIRSQHQLCQFDKLCKHGKCVGRAPSKNNPNRCIKLLKVIHNDIDENIYVVNLTISYDPNPLTSWLCFAIKGHRRE
jgi:hypothetical protein